MRTATHEPANVPTRTPRRILSPRNVCDMLGVNRSTLWRWVRGGILEQPIQLSPNRIGWTVEYVEAWIASRPRTRASSLTPTSDAPIEATT